MSDPTTPATAAGPWCPVCREKVATRAFYNPLSGFHEVFADHGCDGDGRKVLDADHGFLVDGKVVPSWET